MTPLGAARPSIEQTEEQHMGNSADTEAASNLGLEAELQDTVSTLQSPLLASPHGNADCPSQPKEASPVPAPTATPPASKKPRKQHGKYGRKLNRLLRRDRCQTCRFLGRCCKSCNTRMASWGLSSGKSKTKALISQQFYWPRMARQIKDYCRTCPVCLQWNSHKEPKPPLQPLPVLGPRLLWTSLTLYH